MHLQCYPSWNLFIYKPMHLQCYPSWNLFTYKPMHLQCYPSLNLTIHKKSIWIQNCLSKIAIYKRIYLYTYIKRSSCVKRSNDSIKVRLWSRCHRHHRLIDWRNVTRWPSLCSGALKSPHTICRSRDGMMDINVETQSYKSTDSVASDNVTEAVGA